MRALQRCQLLLRAAQAADQSTASSHSGARLLEAALSTRGQGLLSPQPADPHPTAACATQSSFGRPMCMAMGFHTLSSSGACGSAGAVGQPLSGRSALRSGASQLQLLGGSDAIAMPSHAASGTQTAAMAIPGAARGLFGGTAPAPANPQVHTHDKYKQTYWQPSYDWMKGRFVLDRNGAVWHRQANYRHQRYAKSASNLTRLKRWKPLTAAYAKKMIKVGFRAKYWAEPDPQEVPGWLPPGTRAVQRPRWSAVPDLRPDFGDPALRQSYKPPPRQSIR